jgi:hypothetical protein
MLGHVDVDDAPAVMQEHDEDEQHAAREGRDRKEIDGDEGREVIG